MKAQLRTWVAVTSLAASAVLVSAQMRQPAELEALPFAPRQAVCYRSAGPIAIDGRLTEASWAGVPWTDSFVDIEGDRRPRPRLQTRVKMLWDADALYLAADLEEPHVWATLRDRDSVIFHDNDFEVFIDPDGDTHGYFEVEVNALGTPWDLMLRKPYRDGGPDVTAWDIAGLQVGVDVRGTLNNPIDRDRGWTIEIALPLKALREGATGQRPPRAGDQWRVNFSRVEWETDVKEGHYVKRVDPRSGRPMPEDNWTWSPQGVIDMHMPERWGYVQFSALKAGAGSESFTEDPNEQVKWALRRLYYRQRAYKAAHGGYASALTELEPAAIRIERLEFRPSLVATADGYEISAPGFGTVLRIAQDGKVMQAR